MENSFLFRAVNELFTYRTPQSIVDYINLECIFKNPPYDNRTIL